MSRLYIFGNGLDIHYGLNTRPRDFIKHLKHQSIYGECCNAADVFEGLGVLWSNFEEDIADVDLEQLVEDIVGVPDYYSDHEYDRDGVITNVDEYLSSLKKAIFEALKEMISSAERDIRKLGRDYMWKFNNDDTIISFNYTSTIEKVANPLHVPILHIHGCFETKDELILGYKEPSTEFNHLRFSNSEDGDFYMEKQLELINDFYVSLKKEIQLKKLASFLDSVSVIDEVVVMGHSLGSVDIPYFEFIERKYHPNVWKVSYSDGNDAVFANMKQLSFKDKIELFQW